MHAIQNDTVRNNTFSPTQLIYLSIYLVEFQWKQQKEKKKKRTDVRSTNPSRKMSKDRII
jgi:hypothetical protein